MESKNSTSESKPNKNVETDDVGKESEHYEKAKPGSTNNGLASAETKEIDEPVENNKGIEQVNHVENKTRGVKRKATDSEVRSKNETGNQTHSSEHVENRKEHQSSENLNDSANDSKESTDDPDLGNCTNDESGDDFAGFAADQTPKTVSETDTMGKGKRARIPNKRYSDIAMSSVRKSLGSSVKSLDLDMEDILIKEEPTDSPIGSPSLQSSKRQQQRQSSTPTINLQDPKYLKPFKYGWKRELVWRSTSTSLKPLGDIYYYTPTGKKVRSFRELADHLNNRNLTVENFSFCKEPLGVEDPEKEMIRNAKIKSESGRDSPVPPKRTELFKKAKKSILAKAEPAPKVVEGGVAAKRKVDPLPKAARPAKKIKLSPKRGKTPLSKKAKASPAAPALDDSADADATPTKAVVSSTAVKSNNNSSSSKPCQPCSIRCEGVQGLVPTLQCRLCLCLYHHECVGLTPHLSLPYVCKNCHIEQGQKPNQSTTIVAPPPLTPINSLKPTGAPPRPGPMPKLQRIPRADDVAAATAEPLLPEMPKLTPRPADPLPVASEAAVAKSSLVGSVTTWLPQNVKIVNGAEPAEAPRPQYLEFMGGRKFLVIPKHNYMSVSSNMAARTAEGERPAAAAPELPDAADAEQFSLDVKVEPTSPSKPESSQSEEAMDAAKSDAPPPNIETSMNASSCSPSLAKTTKRNFKLRSITGGGSSTTDDKNEAKFMENYLQNLSFGYNTLLYVFQYLKVQDLLRAGCVCTMWRDIASHPVLWRTVRMKNSQVHSFEGLANTLKKHGTVHLDLRKMLLPSAGDDVWTEFSDAIERVDTLRKIELCRCPAGVVERLPVTNPDLEVINAVTIKCESMDFTSLKNLTRIRELRLKSTTGLSVNSIDALKELKTLKILSLTSVVDLHKLDVNVIAELTELESLDLGECTDFPKNFGQDVISKLEHLEKLRLEKGQGNCHTFEIFDAVRKMKKLEQLELVNFDVKTGFDKALGGCHNIKKLMIIPTYISQSATTNNMVLAGVLRLRGSLCHFVWGVTLELLRVTELFVDQCEEPKDKKDKRPTGNGDSIPVLKPVPDLTHTDVIETACNPPQVEILPLPNLQKLLLNSLPTTRVKILKIPFHATWRQTLTDSV
ncbi:uncharacterized protein LOC132704344 [Cylas formicarius]|uniref:uncharacterized protein LOC132704344 n=1 Tax=Cylas formicarius TaxID=197179 RepID=UPI002958740C|nr:uncharacterized protein LOC132704344 [Cylas formicarius]